MKDFFRNYNYKKHAKICAVTYGILFAFDMTVSYVILKRAFAKQNKKEGKQDEV